MTTKFQAVSSAILAGLLTACGGGGGAEAPAAVPAPAASTAVQVTPANANIVAAHAVDSVQNTTGAQAGTGMLTGVQVKAAPASGTMLLPAVVRALAPQVTHLPVAAGVVIDQTVACLNNPNGDGTFETSTSLTAAQLKALL